MSDLPETLADSTKALAKVVVPRLVDTIRKGMGGKAPGATTLPPEDELGAWMRQTATPEQVAQLIADGKSDDEILQKARQYRHALGKAAGRGDPKLETDYHEKMAARANAYQQAIGAGKPHAEAISAALAAKPSRPVKPTALAGPGQGLPRPNGAPSLAPAA